LKADPEDSFLKDELTIKPSFIPFEERAEENPPGVVDPPAEIVADGHPAMGDKMRENKEKVSGIMKGVI
jgi:hypothetical protein